MDIYFYNTLTKSKDKFEPINKEEVRMYSCGPTVYKDASIGNMRTYIMNDLIRRVLKYNGYKIKHTMNITDVGHLVSDADEGEDKMLKSAREMQKTPYEIAKYYTKLFMDDLEKLNVETPEVVCKATDHIEDMIKYVQKLLENGYAYETSTAIYFDVSKLDEYGILSGIKLEDQKVGARVDVDTEKRNPYDFALWIKAKPNHIMKWESPWGLSYPGWHIECSAMGRKYLGDQFDIHTGGIDHIPTHHENEIAQSKGLTGKVPAKTWMHVEFLQVDGGKMSKSLGNTYTLDQLQEKGIEPLAYKLFCFTAHYRTKLNFTFDTALATQKALMRLREGFVKHQEGTENIDEQEIKEYENKFLETINDDLNMPAAMGIVWEIVRNEHKSKQFAELLLKFDKVLGLDLENSKKYLEESKNVELPQEIQELLEKRKQARADKNWALSDEIRDNLKEKGYAVKDTKEGMTVEKI